MKRIAGRPRTRWPLLAWLAAILAVVAALGTGQITQALGRVSGLAATASSDEPAGPDLPQPGTFTWLFGDGYSPITWRCAPIRYRMVQAGAPRAAQQFLDRAFQRVTRASSGAFTFTPAPQIASWDQDDGRWNGITVGWAAGPPQVNWSGSEVGMARPRRMGRHIASARIWLRPPGPDATPLGGSAAPILQQEIGHTLGLGHVAQNRASIMTPVISRTRWSDPDRQALAYLGRYSCRTT